jgi:glycosyltransferase involved in cell wall biosynthesis
MPPTISAFIIALNEEKKIEACLRSLSWVNEIVVVVDSQSVDRTRAIAAQYSARVHTRSFTDFADQKNTAMGFCGGNWLLSIDSDEVVTDELRDEILEVIAKDNACDGYRIPRRSFIFGKEFRFSGTQDDRPVRLFKEGCGTFENPIHESLVIRGAVGELKAPMKHFTYDSVSDYFARFARYTSCEAEFLLKKAHTLRFSDFLLRPVGMFLKLYILKQGFRDGWEGFLFCLFSGGYVFVKYAKYRELRRNSSAPDRNL